MPRRDGTGPWGQGPMTGRGFGPCAGFIGYYSPRRGFCRGFGFGYGLMTSAKDEKEMLEEEKEILENRLKAIESQLENLKKE